MDKKKAFVFDTNFIIENRNLKEVVATLSDGFTVYVTQISIEERISQKHLEIKNKYEKLETISQQYKGIANVKIITSLEKSLKTFREIMEKGYANLFGEHIIPFKSDETTFSKIIDRVYKKCPPFLSGEGASDKGFKDSLIWLSLLDFFKESEEDEIIFVTNDNGFRKNSDALCYEFKEVTKKEIIFKDNNYYKSLFETNTISLEQNVPIPDVKHLREKIHSVILSLCGIETEDYWGAPDWDTTFSLNKRVDGAYMEVVLDGLKKYIIGHIFETEVSAERVLDLDGRVTNGVSIPMVALENALSLYEEIQQRVPSYLPQFYDTAASIINRNYIEPQEDEEDDDRMPF